MSAGTAFALRPLERNPLSASGNALEGAFRVYLSQREQKTLGLTNGDLVRLKTSAGFKGYAVAWLASQTNPGNKAIAKVTDLLREQYGLTLDDPVFVDKASDSWKPLKSIEISVPESAQQKFTSNEELLYWVRHALGRVSHRTTLRVTRADSSSGPRYHSTRLYLPNPAEGTKNSTEEHEIAHACKQH
jgi:AAA family ATPase